MITESLRCPSCRSTEVRVATVRHVALCAGCHAVLLLQPTGTLRVASEADLNRLAPGERALLTQARSALVRGERTSR